MSPTDTGQTPYTYRKTSPPLSTSQARGHQSPSQTTRSSRCISAPIHGPITDRSPTQAYTGTPGTTEDTGDTMTRGSGDLTTVHGTGASHGTRGIMTLGSGGLPILGTTTTAAGTADGARESAGTAMYTADTAETFTMATEVLQASAAQFHHTGPGVHPTGRPAAA